MIHPVYATWCGPCHQIAPLYEQLSKTLSRPKVATFVKVNIEAEGGKAIASEYAVTHLPTFIVFRDGAIIEKVKGADPHKLQAVVEKLSSDIENAGGSSSSSSNNNNNNGGSGGSGEIAWRGADLPRGYVDISDNIDIRGLELLNADSDFSVRTLFSKSKPTALDKGKSIKFVSFKNEGEDQTKVLRLNWKTKYACEGAKAAPPPPKKTSSWGFFTWFLIM